jgi:hypothetical protein
MEHQKTKRMTREEKLARVVKLRDAAIAIVSRRGAWETYRPGAIKIMGARTGRIQISYRTPFQPLPDDQSKQKYLAALFGIPLRQNLPYGLDIWAPKKVLNIEWNDHGKVELVSFRPGEWCMSSEHFGQLAWQFKRVSGSSGLKVQAAIAC